MYMRKFAAAAMFATGAALAFAPLASASPTDPIDPTILNGEIATINSIFAGETTEAKIPSGDLTVTTNEFTTVISADAPKVTDPGQLTVLDNELYGVAPITAGISGDPGAYDVYNGALLRFDEAYNVEAYALANNGALDPNSADFFGNVPSAITSQGETATQAFDYLYNFAIGDLSGYFGTDLSFLDLGSGL